MIRLVTVPLLVLFTTSTVWAETPLATASKIEAARHASTPPSPQPEAAGASHQSVPIAPSKAPSRRHLRCCNVIGALVGGAIGVGLGTFLTRNACDVEDCTSAYVKVSVIFGGLGATIGALGQLSGLPLLFVRKAAKDYGTCRLAEGTEVAGRRVLIVEDVITAGGQVIESAESLRVWAR